MAYYTEYPLFLNKYMPVNVWMFLVQACAEGFQHSGKQLFEIFFSFNAHVVIFEQHATPIYSCLFNKLINLDI